MWVKMKILGLLVLLLIPVVPVEAVDERVASEIANSVMSPFCPGLTLSACTSDDARKLRTEVEGWVTTGLSDEQIKERLVSRFGSEILGVPSANGAAILGWIVPIAVLVAGLVLVMVALTLLISRPKQQLHVVKKNSSSSDELDLRIEEELKRRML